MPRKDITLELPGLAPITFADLRRVPMPRLSSYWQQQVELGGTWRCGDGHEGHLVASIYQQNPPFFRHNHAGCTTCTDDEEPAGESDGHKTAKQLIAADLEHIGLTVDEEYTFNGQRHRADVAAFDKQGGLLLVEVQRSYEQIQHLHMRDKARSDATGHPDRVMWVTDTERERWKGHPLIVCDREFARTRTGLWSRHALNPDEDQPLTIDRGELLERWAAGRVNRIEFPERPTPIGPESQWVDRSTGTATLPRKKRRRPTADVPVGATVCIPCDTCGTRVTIDTEKATQTVLCAACQTPDWEETFTAPAQPPTRHMPPVSAPSPEATGRTVTFDCPRCGRIACEAFYGPCWQCQAALAEGTDSDWFARWTVSNDAWKRAREAS